MSKHDSFLRHQDQIIATLGWAVTYVLPTDDDPTDIPFAYTVGLTERDLPELLIAGLPIPVAHTLLNDLARREHDNGERYRHAQRIDDLLVGYDTVLIDGPLSDRLWPGAAIARYGRERIRVRQIVWPDVTGRFPWDDGYNHTGCPQPLITDQEPVPDQPRPRPKRPDPGVATG